MRILDPEIGNTHRCYAPIPTRGLARVPGGMNLPSVQGLRRQGIEESFGPPPERFIPSDEPLDAAVEIELSDSGRVWRVELTHEACAVAELDGGDRARPDVAIKTDSETWLNLRSGKLTGLEAFEARRLHISGDLALVMRF